MNNLFDQKYWFASDYSELQTCLLKPAYRIPGYRNVVRTYFMSVPRSWSTFVSQEHKEETRSRFFGCNCRRTPDEVLELLMFSTQDDWCYEPVMYHENRTHDMHHVLIVDFFFKDYESSSMFHGCLMSDLTPT